MRLPAIHKKRILELFAGAMLATAGMHAFATGMEPETSVVILNEADGETSIYVKNTDGTISHLHSVIENTPEDKEALVLLTPPVTRVEPGRSAELRYGTECVSKCRSGCVPSY